MADGNDFFLTLLWPAVERFFDRPLQELFNACFEAGFVIDGFEERAFSPDHIGGTFPLSWSGNFSEIPPALIARARSPT